MVLVVATGLGVLGVVLSRAGGDRSVTGTISEQASHRVCVDDGSGPVVCVRVVSPVPLAAFSVGDRVRLSYSAELSLVSLERLDAQKGR